MGSYLQLAPIKIDHHCFWKEGKLPLKGSKCKNLCSRDPDGELYYCYITDALECPPESRIGSSSYIAIISAIGNREMIEKGKKLFAKTCLVVHPCVCMCVSVRVWNIPMLSDHDDETRIGFIITLMQFDPTELKLYMYYKIFSCQLFPWIVTPPPPPLSTTMTMMMILRYGLLIWWPLVGPKYSQLHFNSQYCTCWSFLHDLFTIL